MVDWIRGKTYMDGRWARKVFEWYPRDYKRKQGNSSGQLINEIKKISKTIWKTVAHDRQRWKKIRQAAVDDK